MIRNMPIRIKLTLMMFLTSFIALLTATIGFTLNQIETQFKIEQHEASTYARIIAFNAAPSLLFDDISSAHDLLTSLSQDPDFRNATLLDQHGETFTSFSADNEQAETDTFNVEEPVFLNKQQIGILRLTFDQDSIQSALQDNFWIIALLTLLALIVSFLFAVWMQRFISKPLTQMTNHMQQVAKNKDYTLRIQWQGEDELGLLSDSFNAMLEKIEERDELLEKHHKELEELVAQRTEMLQQGIENLKKAEASLNQIMRAMQQTGEAVLILNTHGNVEYYNPACLELSGYSGDELKDDPTLILTREVIGSTFPKILLGDSWKEEVECVKKDGTPYSGLLSLSPITDDQGKVTQVVAILRDLSDRNALEVQLRQSQKMESVGILAGGIAHDFNNLLAGIVGNLELAKLDMNSPEMLKMWLEKIESISFRAAETIAKLLAFARKNVIQKEDVQLRQLVEDVEHIVKVGTPESIHIDFQMTEEKLWINADAHQLKQVLLNLHNNAAHAVSTLGHDAEKHVTTTISKVIPNKELRQKFATLHNQEYACIQVHDNGPGIAKEHAEKIFEPFFTTKPENQGTGLGLSMAYGMAQSHNGALCMDSEPGVGTTFSLLLPLIPAPATEIRYDDSLHKHIPRGCGETILIADDEELVLSSSKNNLEHLGYKTISAVDGNEALQHFEQHKDEISLVILDLVMPNKGGASTAKVIRQSAPNLPIIFVSGYDMNSTMNDLDGITNYQFIAKPFRLTELARSIRAHLDRTN